MATQSVREFAREAGREQLPAYVYDLGGLGEHVTGIRRALDVPGGPEVFYAAKANPDAAVLRAVAPGVHGVEVASGGELAHVREVLPEARIAFGGPGKTDEELRLALASGVERIHVESPYELRRLGEIALAERGRADVLLRANLAGEQEGVALSMAGPFGMDTELIGACLGILAEAPHLRLRGIHAHLASGLQAEAMVRQQAGVLDWARPWLAAAGVPRPEFNLGGGMGVDYANPAKRFDWDSYGHRISALARPGETLRIEPGRAMSVYHGWYLTDVLDVKRAHGLDYAILRGGTHHFRTPVTKGHDQPFELIHREMTGVPKLEFTDVTLVGQLCTPKDVFARQQPVEKLSVGDLVLFQMAGAYAWNISHHDFLMHPKPTVHYLG